MFSLQKTFAINLIDQQRLGAAVILRRSYGILLTMVVSMLAGRGSQTLAQPICPAQLEGAIAPILQRPEMARARWGILVQVQSALPNQRRTLYQREAKQFFTPASTAKLLTSAAALQMLGPQFQITTSVYSSGYDSAKGQSHNLRVVGRGDPSLTEAGLQQLAQQLARAGVTQVDWLWADDRYFQGDLYHANWEWEDVQAGYGAPINSLILNRNAINFSLVPQGVGQPLAVRWDNPVEGQGWQIENRSVTVAAGEAEFLTVGRDLHRPLLRVSGQLQAGAAAEPAAIAISNPVEHFLQRFRAILLREGIRVNRTGIAPTPRARDEVELAKVRSLPLSELLSEVNQWSDNLYTEVLARQLAVQIRSANQLETDTLVAGLQQMKVVLQGIGVDPQSYDLADGSGLSRHNNVSPEALVQTLQGMATSPHAAIYRSSLAVSGQSGTLTNRLQGVAAGLVQGKTGTLTGTIGLAGYLTPANHPPIVFSILVNQSNQSASVIQRSVDDVVLLLLRLQRCDG